MKILANDGISAKGVEILENAGYTVLTNKISQDELVTEINNQNIEVLLVRSATTARKELIDACPNLKLIGRGGVGMDNIDVEYARSKGILVVNTPAASSQSVAELVIGQLFSISRFLFDAAKNMPVSGTENFAVLKKKYAKGVELRGKTIGIIGFGKIGQAVASYALGIGMNVIAFGKREYTSEITLSIQNIGEVKVPITTTTDLQNKLKECDYISLHMPKQKDGSAVLSTKEFELMKNNVRIVNAARGGVVDEAALLTAIDQGKIAYSALDVYENEPQPMKKLLVHEKIANTPHIGAATVEAQDRIGSELAQQIIDTFGRN